MESDLNCGGAALLYREIRALRIYEGASEVQQLIIGREARKIWREGN